MPTTQFIKNPFTSHFCEQMNVPGTHDRMVAAYLIGTPNPASLVNPGSMAVCRPCAESIVEKLPDELLVHVNIKRALELMSEEQRDALFDKFYPPAGPKEALESLLTELDSEDIKEVMYKAGLDNLSSYGKRQQDNETPVQGPALPPDTDPNQQVQCPYCEFTAKNAAGLSSHIKAKHPEDSQ